MKVYPCCAHCDGFGGVTQLDRHTVPCDEPGCPGGEPITPPVGGEG